MKRLDNQKLLTVEPTLNTSKSSLTDRLYKAWEFAGNLGRRKQ